MEKIGSRIPSSTRPSSTSTSDVLLRPKDVLRSCYQIFMLRFALFEIKNAWLITKLSGYKQVE